MANKSAGTSTRKSSTSKKTAAGPIPIDSGNGVSQANQSALKTYRAIEQPGIEDEIRQRAYEFYQERGRLHGLDQQDWVRAESEILSKHQREKSA